MLGCDPFDAGLLWQKMFRTFTGRSGGVLIEALPAIDIALLGPHGQGAAQARVTSCSAAWAANACTPTRRASPGRATRWRSRRQAGARAGVRPHQGEDRRAARTQAIARCRAVRATVGSRRAARRRRQLGVRCRRRRQGGARAARPRLLLVRGAASCRRTSKATGACARRCRMRFTAGESEHTAVGARDLIASRAVGIVQPDVARSGGISETRNIADARARLPRRLRAARRRVGRGVRRGQPASRRGDAEFRDLRVHDVPQSAARAADEGQGRRSRRAGRRARSRCRRATGSASSSTSTWSSIPRR